jgi:hypothetical protein
MLMLVEYAMWGMLAWKVVLQDYLKKFKVCATLYKASQTLFNAWKLQ